MEIQIESYDSGDDINDGDAECLFCTGFFSHEKHGEKLVQYVSAIVGRMKSVGLRKTTLCSYVQKKM